MLVPILLLAAGGGLIATGKIAIPGLHLGGGAEGGAHAPPGEPAGEMSGASQARAATFVDVPEIIANLNSGRRASFVKLRAKIELSRAEDVAALTTAMPRIVDLFQTYLREMRPEELRGSAGTYRLREELIARASIAVSPARVSDVLFTELLIQ